MSKLPSFEGTEKILHAHLPLEQREAYQFLCQIFINWDGKPIGMMKMQGVIA